MNKVGVWCPIVSDFKKDCTQEERVWGRCGLCPLRTRDIARRAGMKI